MVRTLTPMTTRTRPVFPPPVHNYGTAGHRRPKPGTADRTADRTKDVEDAHHVRAPAGCSW
jgi:hypothetical protein